MGDTAAERYFREPSEGVRPSSRAMRAHRLGRVGRLAEVERDNGCKDVQVGLQRLRDLVAGRRAEVEHDREHDGQSNRESRPDEMRERRLVKHWSIPLARQRLSIPLARQRLLAATFSQPRGRILRRQSRSVDVLRLAPEQARYDGSEQLRALAAALSSGS